jgi:enterochelin esterase-like enzyme
VITLRYHDPDRGLTGVRLVQEIGLSGGMLDFTYDDDGGAWRLCLPPVAVRRLEYRLELRRGDDTQEICDPDNPRRAPGAFGDKSVLEFDGYHPPEWLAWEGAPGHWRDLTIAAPTLDAEISVRIWSAPGARGVLLAHDGPEYDRLAGLSHHSAALVAAGRMPPHHLVLLGPGDRNDWYSANPAYARALADEVLPRVRRELDTTAPVIGLGASLGALSLLHAQRRHPRLFKALFLQSGSFFQPRYDAQESSFPPYLRITRFVAGLRRWRPGGTPVPTVLTCGAVEENLANNRDMVATLRRRGYPVHLIEVPDAHNFVAWRDAWHPALAKLASDLWTDDPPRAQDS